MGAREPGLEVDRAAEQRLGLGETRRRKSPQVVEAALVAVPSVEALRRLAVCDLLLVARELGLDHRRDLLRHRILDVEDVGEVEVVDLGPELGPGLGGDEPGRDAHALAVPPDAALDEVAHAERRPKRPGVDLAATGGRRVAGHHREPAVAAEEADHVLGEAIGEVLVLQVLAEVLERHHRDRRLAVLLVRRRRQERGSQRRTPRLAGVPLASRPEVGASSESSVASATKRNPRLWKVRMKI